MKTYKIHLIRHGLSKGSEEGRYIGHTDVPLTEYGKKQLKNMRADYEYPTADTVISSPLNRCLETARLLYPDKNPVIFDDLAEYDFGEFEGLTADELKGRKDFGAWLAGGEDALAPFGESNGEFRKRICGCFENIINGIIKTDFHSVVIITHGGVIMTIMRYFAFPRLPMHKWLTSNGCGYTLNVDRIIWNNTKGAEVYSEVPLRPFVEEELSDPGDWDKEFAAEDFIGFYSPEKENLQ